MARKTQTVRRPRFASSAWPEDLVARLVLTQDDRAYSGRTYDVDVDDRRIGQVESWMHTPHVKTGPGNRLRRDLKERRVWRRITPFGEPRALTRDTAGEAVQDLLEWRHRDSSPRSEY